jgi:hypothetical protein
VELTAGLIYFNTMCMLGVRGFGTIDDLAIDAGINTVDAKVEFLIDHAPMGSTPDTVLDKINAPFSACGA